MRQRQKGALGGEAAGFVLHAREFASLLFLVRRVEKQVLLFGSRGSKLLCVSTTSSRHGEDEWWACLSFRTGLREAT